LTSLLLYTPAHTPRLRYVCRWIFDERLGIPCILTADAAYWKAYHGPRLWYATEPAPPGDLRILPQGLLQEQDIRPQQLRINRWKHSTILYYNQPGAALPFDILAAVFYLISRYEEYLPHEPDRHGRYPAAASAAARYAFLQEPVVDQWLQQLRLMLVRRFSLELPEQPFRFEPTYDVDIAWKYRHKGPRRYWGGLARDLLQLRWAGIPARIAAGMGIRPDPYYSFDWLDALHVRYGLQPLYFFLVSSGSRYDRNLPPGSGSMQRLMHRTAQRYPTGLHPSYRSHQDEAILAEERRILTAHTGQEVTRSRQHYIKLTLPHTYQRLIAAGITHDYSMGYASDNGFRAGTSRSFPWYNLPAEEATGLRIHPFVYMDATSRFYHRHKPAEAWLEWERLWHAVKRTSGTFTGIWHNHLLGAGRQSRGWRALYQKMLAYAAQQQSKKEG